MFFFRTLFSKTGAAIALYVIIGVFANTAAPHIPAKPDSLVALHSWLQYIISVAFWPLSFWHPVFTTGKWT